MKFGIQKIFRNPIVGLDFYKKLSRRERIFSGVGILVVGLLLGYFLGVSPLLDKIKTVERLILKKENEIEEMTKLKKDFDELKGKLRRIELKLNQQKGGFSLLSFLERTASTVQIRKNISSMRPQPMAIEDQNFKEDSVEVRIENVSLLQIVEFLNAIEDASIYLRVKQVRLKTRYADPNFLDATFLVSSYKSKNI